MFSNEFLAISTNVFYMPDLAHPTMCNYVEDQRLLLILNYSENHVYTGLKGSIVLSHFPPSHEKVSFSKLLLCLSMFNLL
jgi:hypothetical protein